MRLGQFHSWHATEPHVTQLEKATKDFMVGDIGRTEWIDLPNSCPHVIIRRERLPDLVMTPMGYGTLLGDAAVPGNRAGNPESEEPMQGGKKGKR